MTASQQKVLSYLRLHGTATTTQLRGVGISPKSTAVLALIGSGLVESIPGGYRLTDAGRAA